jgi:hypothetical protein
MKILTAALAAAAFLVPASVQAAMIFNVSGTFIEGGTLTGSFTTNDDLTALEAVDITTTTTQTSHYTLASASFSNLSDSMQLKLFSPNRLLNLVFDPSLSPSGVTNLGSQSYQVQGNIQNSDRKYLTGTVTAANTSGAVPEPETWAMMLAGFAAIGWGMRRRQNPSVRLNFA